MEFFTGAYWLVFFNDIYVICHILNCTPYFLLGESDFFFNSRDIWEIGYTRYLNLFLSRYLYFVTNNYK